MMLLSIALHLVILLNTKTPEKRDIQALFWQSGQSFLEEGTAYTYVNETTVLVRYVPRNSTQEE